MPSFGKTSLEQLATCDPRLQQVFMEVIKHVDCTILEGHRGKEKQDEYFRTGKSQKQWPNGEHNATPSRAVDVMVYPIDWNNKARMTYFAGMVMGVAYSLGIKLRWGGDFNSNLDPTDGRFIDMPHFELAE